MDEEESVSQLVNSGYSANRSMVTQAIPEVVNHIKNFERVIPSEVINRAIEIYYSLNFTYHSTKNNLYGRGTKTKSVKGNRQKKLIFFCIFKAYDDLDQTVDPYYVANLVEMNQLDTNQAFNECCPNGKFTITPDRFINFYLDRIQEIIDEAGVGIKLDQKEIYDNVKNIIETCQNTQFGKNTLNNIPSGKIAIVSIYFYLTRFCSIPQLTDIAIFEEAGYLSGACIRNYLETIEKCYNSRGEAPSIKRISTYW